MKKILISVSVIAAVAAVVAGVTTAFFSDTETSTGNTFTAGSIDLRVDLKGTDGLNTIEPFGLTDLEGRKIFNYTDLKPGDKGEATISLHVYDNDAWGCLDITNLQFNDNGCTEPEAIDAGDNTCNEHPDGELQNYLLFTVWRDYNCDNVLDEGETIVDRANNKLIREMTLPIADSQNLWGNGDTDLKGSYTYCIGISWNLPWDTGNIVQSDSVVADGVFSAIQSRNNPDFTCLPK